jgi:hypothetical protein
MIGGITAIGLSTGSEVLTESVSGALYPQHIALTAQKPAATFSTVQIAAALDESGLVGASIAGLAAGFKMYLFEHATGGTRSGVTAHNLYTMVKGIVAPISLTCDHQGDAVLSYAVAIASTDGATAPVVIAVDQSLPTPAGDTERFTLGAFTFESLAFTQAKRFTLNFGIDAQVEGADSDIWDTFPSIRSIAPSITLEGIDPNWLAAAKIPLAGLAVTHANTAFYLRKRDDAGSFVVDGTAEHIKFTADGFATISEPIQWGGSGPATCTLELPLRYDGTNPPLILDTSSAIT